jgi:hypothetical protein
MPLPTPTCMHCPAPLPKAYLRFKIERQSHGIKRDVGYLCRLCYERSITSQRKGTAADLGRQAAAPIAAGLKARGAGCLG